MWEKILTMSLVLVLVLSLVACAPGALLRPGFILFPLLFFPILAWVLWLLLGRMMFRTSRAAILATAIPQALLAIAIYTIGYLLQPLSRTEIGIAQYCFNVGAVIAVLAFLSSVIFAIMRKWEIAKGTGIVGGVGLVLWIITFAVGYGMGLG